ncbi:MAG: transglutaminase family protein [Chloroflexi bacterium]|nr:transglutaminase family protein [Chloroflexota bacterium]
MSQSDEIYRRFAREVAAPDDDIDLGRAALLIAATEYPQLDVENELAHLDSLAAAASSRLSGDRDPLYVANLLSEFLFDEIGFRGNHEDYYDPRNSFLNEVLSRRLGIPISLSLLYVEVGKRLGVPLVGVGMPGHFLVRHRDLDDLFIDPFHGGILLSERECQERLQEVTQAEVQWDSSYVAPVTKREFLARLLRNLKGVCLAGQDYLRALTIIDWMLTVQPDGKHELRDRGIVHYRLGNYSEALDDLRSFLAAAPSGSETESVQQLVGRLRTLLDD